MHPLRKRGLSGQAAAMPHELRDTEFLSPRMRQGAHGFLTSTCRLSEAGPTRTRSTPSILKWLGRFEVHSDVRPQNMLA